MKKLFSYIFFCLLSVGFFSCENDETKVVMSSQRQAPALTTSNSAYLLNASTASDSTVTFSWSKANYGFQAAVRYTLQIAKTGTNFANPKEVTVGSALQMKYTTADFNQMVIILGLKPNASGQLDLRVKATVADAVAPLYSNVSTISVTPYLVVINYPSLWVAGDFQGWNPATAPKISSRNANGIYEGYVYIAGGTRQFKYTSQPDWNGTNYGWASSTTTGSDVAGTFSSSGGNLFVPEDGFYLLKGNTNNSTWSATKTTWGIIGDATGNGWSSDVPMTYDVSKNVWKITTTLKAGPLKFIANGAWTINLGDTGADLSLEYDGDNIVIPASLAGTRTIILDLKAGNYTYTIE